MRRIGQNTKLTLASSLFFTGDFQKNDSIIAFKYASLYLRKAKNEKDTVRIANAYSLIATTCINPKYGIMYSDSIISLTRYIKNNSSYPALGYIQKGHLLTVTRDDLVGQYIGHTAPKTKEVLKKAMGGVLFIDEAYYLYKPDNERDYGSEAIEILLQVMENQRDDLVVILAGYKEPMDKFYDSNPGLSSRISNHIDFPDYTVDELLEIVKTHSNDLEILVDGINQPKEEASYKKEHKGLVLLISGFFIDYKNLKTDLFQIIKDILKEEKQRHLIDKK